jgi:hypothetical protein
MVLFAKGTGKCNRLQTTVPIGLSFASPPIHLMMVLRVIRGNAQDRNQSLGAAYASVWIQLDLSTIICTPQQIFRRIAILTTKMRNEAHNKLLDLDIELVSAAAQCVLMQLPPATSS